MGDLQPSCRLHPRHAGMQYVRDEIDLTPTLGRLNLLAPADQLALDPQDLAKGPNPAKAPVQLDDVSACSVLLCCLVCATCASIAVDVVACRASLGCRLPCLLLTGLHRNPAPCRSCVPTCPRQLPSFTPTPQLNLVVVLDGPQPKLLPNFNVGPLRLGWSINIDGTYVSGFLE